MNNKDFTDYVKFAHEEMTFKESDRLSHLYENRSKIELASRVVLLERELAEAIKYIYHSEIENKQDKLKHLVESLCIITH